MNIYKVRYGTLSDVVKKYKSFNFCSIANNIIEIKYNEFVLLSYNANSFLSNHTLYDMKNLDSQRLLFQEMVSPISDVKVCEIIQVMQLCYDEILAFLALVYVTNKQIIMGIFK